MALPGLTRVARAAVILLATATVLAAVGGCARAKVYREGAARIVGSVGDRIVIELASDPTTGYSWMLVGRSDPLVLTLFETDYVRNTAAGAEPAGHQRWTFGLVGRGSTAITFSYGRTWANAPAEKATLFNVTVQ